MSTAASVYLDHNAATPLRAEAREAWLEALAELGGNPGSVHGPGRRARHRLDLARAEVAEALGVGEDEVLFTSGGTESNNLALHGAAQALAARGSWPGVVTTAIEHASVLGPVAELERRGCAVERVGVDARGRVRAEDLAQAARRLGAGLVSVQAANNEIGSLGPLARLAAALESTGSGDRAAPRRPLLHTDAVQALGRVRLELSAWGVDLATFSAHKVGGPVGVGVLFQRRGTPLAARAQGGEQEHGLRPGTENVAGAAAAARAISLAVRECDALAARLQELGRTLWEGIATAVPAARLLGPAADDPARLPGTLNVLFPGWDGRVLVARLDLAGLFVSAGSACASGSLEPSHVLRALGLDDDASRAGLRLSLGRSSTLTDVRQAVDILSTTLGGTDATRGASKAL